VTERDRFPLTTAQKGIGFGQCLDPESPAYWAAEYLELHGALQQVAWQSSVLDVLSSTEALHQRYVRHGTDIWQYAAATWSARLPIHDFSREPDPKAAAERWMHADLQRRVDLTEGPLFSTALLRLAADRHYWYFSAHHLALDGFGFSLLEKRVVRSYADTLAGKNPRPAAAIRLREVSAEEERYRASPAFAIDQQPLQVRDPLAPVIQLNDGHGPALFCVHPADGLAWCYAGLGRYLPHTRIVGLQAPGLTGEDPPNFDAVVSQYLHTIRTLQPDGPYRLLGWSSGGGIAHALAVELQRAGETVSVLALLDSYPADIWHGTAEPTREDALVSMLDELDASPTAPDGRRYDSAELLARLKRPGGSLSMFPDATLWRMSDVAWASMRGYRKARHACLADDLLFFRAQRRSPNAPDHRLWAQYLAGNLECVDIDAGHLGMGQPTSLQQIARVLSTRL